MQISNTFNSNIFNLSNTTSGKTASNESFEFSSAVTKSEEQDGEFLGLTMLPEEGKHNIYGMRAKLSSQSTIDNPIVQVISNFDGKKEVFDIEIKKIDPKNASRMEMFALCCYEDKYGTGTGSTFGSFHTFRMYEETAIQNGYLNRGNDQMSALEQFRNEKENWINLTEFVLNVYKLSPDIKALDMYFKGTKLFNFYNKYAGVTS